MKGCREACDVKSLTTALNSSLQSVCACALTKLGSRWMEVNKRECNPLFRLCDM